MVIKSAYEYKWLTVSLCLIAACCLTKPTDSIAQTAKAENRMESEGEQTAQGSERFTIKFSTEKIDHFDLNETYTFSPLDSFLPASNDTWSRKWKDERLYWTLVYNITTSKHMHFSTGIHLGINRAQFSANNLDTGFYEWWETEIAPFWGLHLVAEFYEKQADGFFLRVVYDLSYSDADEDDEVIIGGRDKSNGSERNASFDWRNQEVDGLIGWRGQTLIPMIGLSYGHFNMTKELDYQLNELNNPLEVALNAEDSRYSYENNESLSLVLALEWIVTPNVMVSGLCRVTDNPNWLFSVAFSF